MKKFPFLILAFVALFITVNARSAKPDARNVADDALTGTWQLCNATTLQPDTAIGGKPGIKRFKFINNNKFLVIETRQGGAMLVGSFSGAYIIDGDNYVETIDLNAPNIYGRPAQPKFSFKYKIKNGLLYVDGTDNGYHEVWAKVK
ncbi:DUF4488 domain-containing protein [Mucilaginibacter myungsuensis]|uniref:DUF4488 domain-containing protein n=1 Tax=Mucilaginibacter myungsuensis TaxID=649104 RepID=A0A929L081_9SPHI|nr:DUF4488 domain-containing protein [Mucilaginibacter myungsuensis]MBE9661770.1 DUF4488 domain-containing protein [Mucilaginibacter myungsuensis]MDN3599796.1 DUF4488 domain-containing protein [Mucilaginibacter myungsuensis]